MAKLEVITAIKSEMSDGCLDNVRMDENTLLISELGLDSIDMMLIGDKLDLDIEGITDITEDTIKDISVKDVMEAYEPKPEKNKYLSPEDYHRVWYQKMTDDGWTYGPVLSFEKREHPHILPFSNLTEERKAEIVGLLLP